MPNFEHFTRDLVPLRSEPTLTIHRRGLLSLNRGAYDALGSPGAVELLYDRQARIIGLHPTGTSTRDAVYVRPATRSASGPWVVSAMAFLKHYGVDIDVSRRWPAYVQDGVLCTDLSEPGVVVRATRTLGHPETGAGGA